MPRRHQIVLALFAAWNLVVWGFRLTTIGNDVDTSVGERLVLGGLALSHVLCGLVVVAVLLASQRAIPGGWAIAATAGVAAWTVGSWTVRLVAILTGGHELAFVLVHTVLAVLSCALAVSVWRLVARAPLSEASLLAVGDPA